MRTLEQIRKSPEILPRDPETNKRSILHSLLEGSLDFHDEDSRYVSHSLHPFPATFPPQLPGIFIENLTQPGETVLDPMVGSGTTLLEASLRGRKAIGYDIDLLALHICRAKITKVRPETDYMRAHKFSLVWFGHCITELGTLRKQYIGAEHQVDIDSDSLPDLPLKILSELSALDLRKAKVLNKYFLDMKIVLEEMCRLLKKRKCNCCCGFFNDARLRCLNP